MKKKLIAFTVDTLEEAEKIILESKSYTSTPVLYFQNYILKGFGSDFIFTLRDMLVLKYGKSGFKILIDCGIDYGLCISMATKKIEYIKVRGNSIILSKIKNILKKNRVLLNPSFNIVDCRNRKNIKFKLKKIYSKDKI